MLVKSRFLSGYFLFMLLPLNALFAQTFQREINTIPVSIDGQAVQAPFAGGLTLSKPALADIDHDGDLDLFIGARNGKLHFYRNAGTATTPAFVLVTEKFADVDVGNKSVPTFADIDNDGRLDLFVGEADGNINFYHNIGSAAKAAFLLESENFVAVGTEKGSAPAFADIDSDGDQDLFVGFDSGIVSFFLNSGTAEMPDFALEAEKFASIDVGSSSYPTFVDIDNDEDLDLLVGNLTGGINFYRNTGTVTNPDFRLQANAFSSIDVGTNSAPLFADIDNDSDLDLLIGNGNGSISFYPGRLTDLSFTLAAENFGSIDAGDNSAPFFADIDGDDDLDLFAGHAGGTIELYRNLGTASSPDYAFDTDNFASFDVGLNSMPTFVDIDEDGDLEMIVGEFEGSLNFFQNVGTSAVPIFNLDANLLASVSVGLNSAPAFADVDDDGDLDLFVGADDGTIQFYQNIGTGASPAFTLTEKNFGNIDVGEKSAPVFTDVDRDHDLDLLIGEQEGNLNFYRNAGTPNNAAFVLESEDFALIDVGEQSAPTFFDFDQDGDPDLFVGKQDGRIEFYRNTSPATSLDFEIKTANFVAMDVGLSSAPTFADIDGDGDLDLFVGQQEGTVAFYRNSGSASSPAFVLEPALFTAIDVGLVSAPAFCDIDDDGDLDLFVGGELGNVVFYRNTGTARNPAFALEPQSFTGIEAGSLSRPAFADIDGDGDADLFVGGGSGKVNFYRNVGTLTSADFVLEPKAFAAIDVGTESAPALTDIDLDGDFDLLVGESKGKIQFYRNNGSAVDPHLTLETETFAEIDAGASSTLAFADVDHDGDADLFVGQADGGLLFYRNVTTTDVLSPPATGAPQSFDLKQNYPNPFNPATTIDYQLPKSTQVKLAVYNLLGQPVATLVKRVQPPGSYSVQWNGKDNSGRPVASGVYFYKLETREFVRVRKLILVR